MRVADAVLIFCLAPFIFSATGCAAPSRGAPPIVEPASRARVVELGRSVLGRPIRMHVFGAAARPVLILGGIHGDEAVAVDVARRLTEHLRRSAPRGSVAVIPIVNPDAVAAGTRGNARGVDCNRNFPATNWSTQPRGRYWSGPRPGTEPETRAVARAVAMLDPRCIVAVHAISGDRQCNNFDGPGESLARVMSRFNGYPALGEIGYPTPGSLGSWAGRDQRRPVITLELPHDADIETVWPPNRDALLALVSAAFAPAGSLR